MHHSLQGKLLWENRMFDNTIIATNVTKYELRFPKFPTCFSVKHKQQTWGKFVSFEPQVLDKSRIFFSLNLKNPKIQI